MFASPRHLQKIIISESGLNKHVKVFTSKRVGNWLIIRIKTYFENIKDQPVHTAYYSSDMNSRKHKLVESISAADIR